MAFKSSMLKNIVGGNSGSMLGIRRWSHISALPPPLSGAVEPSIASPPLVLPEFNVNPEKDSNRVHMGFGFPSFSFGGSMELMAVPKKKVSKHKRGIRNGPRALKPTPVIIRCKSCGRVKLPHFYCCSGERVQPGEHNN